MVRAREQTGCPVNLTCLRPSCDVGGWARPEAALGLPSGGTVAASIGSDPRGRQPYSRRRDGAARGMGSALAGGLCDRAASRRGPGSSIQRRLRRWRARGGRARRGRGRGHLRSHPARCPASERRHGAGAKPGAKICERLGLRAARTTQGCSQPETTPATRTCSIADGNDFGRCFAGRRWLRSHSPPRPPS